MKINYKLFTKHAEKVTKNSPEHRPVLKGVNHDDKGTLTVTDSFRMYQAKGVNAPTNAVINPTTGEEIDKGTYPDVSRLIPEHAPKFKLNIEDVSKFAKVLKAMMAAARVDGTKKEDAIVEITDGILKLSRPKSQGPGTNRVVTFEYEPDSKTELEATTNEVETVNLSLHFILEAVEMFDDMNAGGINLNVYATNRPMTITPDSNDRLLALVLPIRRY